MQDFDKKEIEEILGSISKDAFAPLVAIARKVTDYRAEEETMANPDMRKNTEVDDEIGRAVVFDEEQQEEDDDEGYENPEELDDAKRVQKSTRAQKRLMKVWQR